MNRILAYPCHKDKENNALLDCCGVIWAGCRFAKSARANGTAIKGGRSRCLHTFHIPRGERQRNRESRRSLPPEKRKKTSSSRENRTPAGELFLKPPRATPQKRAHACTPSRIDGKNFMLRRTTSRQNVGREHRHRRAGTRARIPPCSGRLEHVTP